MLKKQGNKISNNPVVTGNVYFKYDSKHYLERIIVYRFLKDIQELASGLDHTSILDVGCGEGFVTNLLSKIKECPVVGVDIGEDVLINAKKDYPYISFIQGSAYELPFDKKAFDLVVACEVLEHLEHTEVALEELRRVSGRWVIISVPREPLWRILNLLRGKYIKNLGNTPGHVQHWGSKDLISIVGRYFNVLEIRKPIPWTILLCKVKCNTSYDKSGKG